MFSQSNLRFILFIVWDCRNQDDRLCLWWLIRNCQMYFRPHARRCYPFELQQSPARQCDRRFSGRQINNPHVLPEHTPAKARAERLGTGFFCGISLGVGFNPVQPPLRFRDLDFSIDTLNETLPETVQGFFYAPDTAASCQWLFPVR